MIICDKHITLPHEGTGDYDSNWRHKLVTVIRDEPNAINECNTALKDKYIADYIGFLRCATRFGMPVNPRYRPYHAAHTWYGSDDINAPRFRIEPLLLTGASYDVIAADLGDNVDPEAVKLYEKLYFNVREDNGDLKKGCFLRSKIAMDARVKLGPETPVTTVWKMAGFTFGYAGLVTLWGWEKYANGIEEESQSFFNEVWRMSQVNMMNAVLRSQISSFDLNNLMGNYIQYKRMQHDTGAEESGSTELLRTTFGILQHTAPRVLGAAIATDEEIQAMTNKEIEARLEAQKQVARTKLSPSGEGMSAINNLIQKQVSEGLQEEKM